MDLLKQCRPGHNFYCGSVSSPGSIEGDSWLDAQLPLQNWIHGRPVALDVHVISPLQQQTLAEAASTPSHGLRFGTRSKLTSHLSACRFVGVKFISLVIETLGGYTQDTIFTIRILGQTIGQRAATPDPSISKHYRVAIA